MEGIFLHDAAAFTAVVRPEMFEWHDGKVVVVADGPAKGHTIMDKCEFRILLFMSKICYLFILSLSIIPLLLMLLLQWNGNGLEAMPGMMWPECKLPWEYNLLA